MVRGGPRRPPDAPRGPEASGAVQATGPVRRGAGTRATPWCCGRFFGSRLQVAVVLSCSACPQLATDPLRQHGACDAGDRFRGSGVGGHGAVRSAAPRLRSKQHLARVAVKSVQQFLLLVRGLQRLRHGLEPAHVCPGLPGGVLWPELRLWKGPPVLQHTSRFYRLTPHPPTP